MTKQRGASCTIEPVDFVLTWVDDTDPEWQRARAKYSGKGTEVSRDGDLEAMFRDQGMLRYWFRAVEKYAPWVRTVHFVTAGHVPGWLNLHNPKLKVVRHDQILSSDVLPTFNPRAIQSGFLRIPNLADHFVVFDDDTLVNQPVDPDFFFPGGLPYGMALPNALAMRSSHSHALLNVSGFLNEHFNQRQVLRSHWRKWLSPKYGKELFRSAALLPWPYILPFAISHLPVPVSRPMMEEAYEAAEEDLEATSARRFRDPKDMLPVQLTVAWQNVKGMFTPVSRNSIGKSFDLGSSPLDQMRAALFDPRVKTVCYNDSNAKDTAAAAGVILEGMQEKYPKPSSFETGHLQSRHP